MMFCGVFMSTRRGRVPMNPNSIRRTQSAPKVMNAVEMQDFMSLKFFDPNRLETTTEQPMLLPKAKAV